MLQNFKRHYYQFVTDPALVLMLPFWPVYVLGLILQISALWFPALLIIFTLAFWQKFCRTDIGRNFQALPALPGGYRTVGQRAPKGAKQQTCMELRQSLLQDSRDAAGGIPGGKYQAITHETVLRRLEGSERISVESVRPVYKGTLQPILNAQSKRRRCQICDSKALCSAWNASARQFYLVRFHVY